MQLSIQGQVQRSSGFTLALDEILPLAGVTAIVGGSGAGKTTLLRAIAGLEPRSQLRISLNEERWQGEGFFLAPHLRPVGTVFQEPRLFPHLSVQKNLKFALDSKLTRGYRMEYSEAVDALDLKPLLKESPSQLSGGQAQRVALARTLLRGSAFWLFDEPLSALDHRARHEIAPYLQRLCRSHQVPILYVTHALSEVLQIADRMLVMDQGRVVASGALDETAAHFGSELPLIEDVGGVLSCRFERYLEGFGLSELKISDTSLFVQGNLSSAPSPIRLFVPARDVSIATRDITHASLLNHLPARIEAIERKNEDTCLVHLRCHEQILLSRITAYSAQQLNLTPTMQVQALIKTVTLATPEMR